MAGNNEINGIGLMFFEISNSSKPIQCAHQVVFFQRDFRESATRSDSFLLFIELLKFRYRLLKEEEEEAESRLVLSADANPSSQTPSLHYGRVP